MRAFRPRGVAIWRRDTSKDPPFRNVAPEFICTIKGKGRTGAAVRSRLMGLSDKQREPILREWAAGRCVEL